MRVVIPPTEAFPLSATLRAPGVGCDLGSQANRQADADALGPDVRALGLDGRACWSAQSEKAGGP